MRVCYFEQSIPIEHQCIGAVHSSLVSRRHGVISRIARLNEYFIGPRLRGLNWLVVFPMSCENIFFSTFLRDHFSLTSTLLPFGFFPFFIGLIRSVITNRSKFKGLVDVFDFG